VAVSIGYSQTAEHVRRRMVTKAATLAVRPKPYDGDWLRARYVDDGLDCVQIGALLGRDPKTVWSWLKFYGIPTRPRGGNHVYLPKDGSTFRGKRHTPETKERIRQVRLRDGRVPYLKDGVHWTKAPGFVHGSTWKGGISPERQAFYASDEWRVAVPAVYARDKRTCQRCGKVKGPKDPFDIHHVVSFECRELRSTISNLVLYWVHSRANTQKEFIRCR
jgi:hypothetical protein